MDKSKSVAKTYNKIAIKYTDAYYNDLSDVEYLDLFIDLLPTRARVLDIGCGPGHFTQYLFKDGFDVEGVDLSDEMLKIAKQNIPEVNFKKMDMRKLEYQENHFDGLLAAYSIIHIPTDELQKVFQEFRRVLKDDGIGLIIVQEGKPDHVVQEPLDTSLEIFLNLFTPERITKEIENAGFKILEQKIGKQKNEGDILSDRVIYTYFKNKVKA